MATKKSKNKLYLLVGLVVLSAIGTYFVIPFAQVITGNATLLSSGFETPFSLVPLSGVGSPTCANGGLSPAQCGTTTTATTTTTKISAPTTTTATPTITSSKLSCTMIGDVNENSIDGTVTKIITNSISFTPANILVQNPTGRNYDKSYDLIASVNCKYANGLTPQISGSYTIYYYTYWVDSTGKLGRSPIGTVTKTVPSTYISNGGNVKLGTDNILPSSLVRGVPVGITKITFIGYFQPSFHFYVPQSKANTAWNGYLYFNGFDLKLLGNLAPTTPTTTTTTTTQQTSSPTTTNPSQFSFSLVSPNGKTLTAFGEQTTIDTFLKLGYTINNVVPIKGINPSQYLTVSQAESFIRSNSPSCDNGINPATGACITTQATSSNAGSPSSNDAVPLTSYIHYKIFFDDNTNQVGDSSNKQNVVFNLPTASLFKQTNAQNPPSIKDMTFTVIVSNANQVQETIQNSQIKFGAVVKVGDHAEFQLTQSDFSQPTYLNSINYGLVTIQLPIANLENAIRLNVGDPTADAQPASVTITADGTFTAVNKGNSFNGVISGLTYTFPLIYANAGSTNTATGNSNPNNSNGIPNCNSSQVLKALSGGGYVCVDNTDPNPCVLASGIANPLAPQSCNTPSAGSPSSSKLKQDLNTPPSSSDGVTGYCKDTTDAYTCIMEVFSKSGIDETQAIIAFVIGIGLFIVVGAVMVNRRKTITA